MRTALPAPTNPTSASTSRSDAIAAATADDKLFFSGAVDGNRGGPSINFPGSFVEEYISYPSGNQNVPVYAYLWSDSHAGDIGDTFGLVELTIGNERISPPSGLGNYEFRINTDVFVNPSYTVVPEPIAYGGLMGALCSGFAVLRKIARKNSDAAKRTAGRV